MLTTVGCGVLGGIAPCIRRVRSVEVTIVFIGFVMGPRGGCCE